MNKNDFSVITIVGGGLAGSEAAWQLAERGYRVRLYEMRPQTMTEAHQSKALAELVCSNSLKSLTANSAAGCLKYELAKMGSALLGWALQSRVPAGKALAVDRDAFSELVSAELEAHRNIEIMRTEFVNPEDLLAVEAPSIIATGPLTSAPLHQALSELLGSVQLAFFDAAAPIVEAESLDFEKLFAQSRYLGDEAGDYLNAALNKEQYQEVIEALLGAELVIQRSFESRDLFQACQPIEEVARKGQDSLRFGALKPVGLKDPKTGKRPWAVVQLRAENRARTAYNLVGFQTNLRFSEQQRVFRMIPGLEQADFSRFGVMHRNTYLDAPRLLNSSLALRQHQQLHFAGQITGTEGYLEAVASGLLAALSVHARLQELPAVSLPDDTAFGALIAYAANPDTGDYQPMHVNFGIMPPLAEPLRSKKERYRAFTARAQQSISAYRLSHPEYDFLPELATDFLETTDA